VSCHQHGLSKKGLLGSQKEKEKRIDGAELTFSCLPLRGGEGDKRGTTTRGLVELPEITYKYALHIVIMTYPKKQKQQAKK
jgi:hypothetical protein